MLSREEIIQRIINVLRGSRFDENRDEICYGLITGLGSTQVDVPLSCVLHYLKHYDVDLVRQVLNLPEPVESQPTPEWNPPIIPIDKPKAR